MKTPTCSGVTVHTDPVQEAIARKLQGIAGVPPIEQTKMIRRACKAGASAVWSTVLYEIVSKPPQEREYCAGCDLIGAEGEGK